METTLDVIKSQILNWKKAWDIRKKEFDQSIEGISINELLNTVKCIEITPTEYVSWHEAGLFDGEYVNAYFGLDSHHKLTLYFINADDDKAKRFHQTIHQVTLVEQDITDIEFEGCEITREELVMQEISWENDSEVWEKSVLQSPFLRCQISQIESSDFRTLEIKNTKVKGIWGLRPSPEGSPFLFDFGIAFSNDVLGRATNHSRPIPPFGQGSGAFDDGDYQLLIAAGAGWNAERKDT